MEERKENLFLDGKSSKEMWEDLIKEIWESAKELKITVVKKSQTVIEMTVNLTLEAKNQRKKVWDSLKKWLQTKEENDKRGLNKEKALLKIINSKNKKEQLEQKWKNIEGSRNMNDFWKVVGQFRPRKAKKRDRIAKKDWVNHFKKILGIDQERMEEIDLT